MRFLKTLIAIAGLFCAGACRGGAPASPPALSPAGAGRPVVIFPFAGGGVFSGQFYDLASGEIWPGQVVSRAVLAGEVKKLGAQDPSRLTREQVKAIAGRLGAGIVITGREEAGGRVYVYVADLEARVAFIMRDQAGNSSGKKALLDGLRRYAGLSAHERATLAKVRFRKEPAGAAGAARKSPSPPPGAPGAGKEAGEPPDVSALNKIRIEVSELDAIDIDDLDLKTINTDDLKF
ncbi:MAG: hypothetical protein PHV33_04070 [Elusimicrobiales bacterium]|nr:hypothetical protein [Elusimicrobiales bacterium]